MKNKIPIIVLTQEDYFFIPSNIEKLSKIANIKEIVVLNTQGALVNKTKQFINWFGIFQVGKMALKVYYRRILNILDPLFGFKILNGKGSVKLMAKKMNIPLRTETKINGDDFFKHIQQYDIKLMVSYSCPVVIKERLLNYPKYGVINVHGSYLPAYQGLLPSFWHLRFSEKYAGATVHYMSQKIDDGDIILQDKVDISKCKSMFDVMKLTKLKGGELMVNAITQIENNTVQIKPNNTKEGHYYSWPKDEDVNEFKKKGYRFV